MQLVYDDAPFYLFKNIVTNGARGIHLIQKSMSTFIDPLNDDYAIQNLVPIAESKTRVLFFYTLDFFLYFSSAI